MPISPRGRLRTRPSSSADLGPGALPYTGRDVRRADRSSRARRRGDRDELQPRPDPRRVSTVGTGAWVVLPTYNEAENLRPISAAILDQLPGATLLVVDDGSPDGTGQQADELASADPRVKVRHRAAKQGLGRAYLDGFGVAISGGAAVVIQMDADFSHDPAVLPALIGPIAGDRADLVIGSRYVPGRRGPRLGHHPSDHLARREPVREGRPWTDARTT